MKRLFSAQMVCVVLGQKRLFRLILSSYNNHTQQPEYETQSLQQRSFSALVSLAQQMIDDKNNVSLTQAFWKAYQKYQNGPVKFNDTQNHSKTFWFARLCSSSWKSVWYMAKYFKTNQAEFG